MSHDTSKITNVLPFSLTTASKSFRKDRGDLLGNVDVSYAKGKKAKISIYRGDNPV